MVGLESLNKASRFKILTSKLVTLNDMEESNNMIIDIACIGLAQPPQRLRLGEPR